VAARVEDHVVGISGDDVIELRELTGVADELVSRDLRTPLVRCFSSPPA
jgi:hypothetical protein